LSELNATIEFLEDSVEENIETEEIIIEKPKIITESIPFDIKKFRDELEIISRKKNQQRAERPNQNITGYDIAHNCIMQVLFKLRNTPIKNYADIWLPIFMRTELGNAVHRFIQDNTKQFTEVELNLKVPSIRFY